MAILLTNANHWCPELMAEHKECFLIDLFNQNEIVVLVRRVKQSLDARMAECIVVWEVPENFMGCFQAPKRSRTHIFYGFHI